MLLIGCRLAHILQIRDGCKFSDVALLVYTSGTTGLPKVCSAVCLFQLLEGRPSVLTGLHMPLQAATIKHLRLFSMGFGFTT